MKICVWILLINDEFMSFVVWQPVLEIYQVQREAVFLQVSKQVNVSLALSLVHTSSQWSCDVQGSEGCPAPAVQAV